MLYYLQDKEEEWIQDHLNDICASVSFAIAEVLVKKLKRAVEQTGVETVLLAGGVSANSMLREKSEKMAEELGVTLYSPKLSYCTDNAAMIAITGKMKADLGQFDDLDLVPFSSLS